MLANLLDLVALLVLYLAAPLVLAGEWLRDQAEALRYREAVLLCLDCDGRLCDACIFDSMPGAR